MSAFGRPVKDLGVKFQNIRDIDRRICSGNSRFSLENQLPPDYIYLSDRNGRNGVLFDYRIIILYEEKGKRYNSRGFDI